jgi:dual specificity phosphatase 12
MINNLYYYSYLVYSKLRGFINYNIPTNFEVSMDEVYPNIFIGNLACIYNTETLDKHGIKNIITAVSGITPPYPEKYNYLNLNLIDSYQEEIINKFNESNKFIEESIKNNEKILVHCICGVSRSSTLVIAYLLSKKIGTVDNIKNMLKEKRDIVNPIDTFIDQLELYNAQLNPIEMINN